jgi:hypothetical protein
MEEIMLNTNDWMGTGHFAVPENQRFQEIKRTCLNEKKPLIIITKQALKTSQHLQLYSTTLIIVT